MKKYLSLVLLYGGLTPWVLAVDDADILKNANGNAGYETAEPIVTLEPMAQAGQEAFSLPQYILSVVNEQIEMLEGVPTGTLNPHIELCFTADNIARTASLKKVATDLQALAQDNPKITDIFHKLDEASNKLQLPSGNDYSAFLNGTVTPVTHTLTLFNQVVLPSIEAAIKILEIYIALIFNKTEITDQDIRIALDDFADALIATVLLLKYANSENIFWQPGFMTKEENALFVSSVLNFANQLVKQMAISQDLIKNNLLGALFRVLSKDMPTAERENIPAALIISMTHPIAQEALNNLDMGGTWGGINGRSDSFL